MTETNVLQSEEKATKKVYTIRVEKGTVKNEEKEVERKGYAKKVANLICSKLRSGMDVELSAISSEAVVNMTKAIIHANAEMSSYKKKIIIKDVYFKEISIGKDKKSTATAKVFLLTDSM